jgi:arylsulfatase A-like enzyme
MISSDDVRPDRASLASAKWGLRSLVYGRWKFIQAPADTLFDVHSDPEERNDLARQHPITLEALRQMFRWHRDAAQGPGVIKQPAVAPDPDDLEMLRQLGYIQ